MDQTTSEEYQSSALQTCDYLQKYFNEFCEAKCMLWVDPAQSDPFINISWAKECRIRVPIRHQRFDIRHAPYLLLLDLRDSSAVDVLKHSVDIAWDAWTIESLSSFQSQPVAGWVATQMPLQSLAAHWASQCHIHRRKNLTKLLRFHDPGVREWLWPALDESQRHSLLGPSESIFSIGRQHVLHRHTRESGKFSTDLIPSLRLQENQWVQIEDYMSVHAAWVKHLTDKQYSAKAWEQKILNAMAYATDYGLKDLQDRELFALHALQLGFDFHASEKMLPLWARTKSGFFYGSAIEEVFGCSADQLHLHFKC